MKKDARISLLLAGVMIFSSIGAGIVLASPRIDDVLWDVGTINANPDAVKKFVEGNPGAAARLLQNNPAELTAVCALFGINQSSDCGAKLNEFLRITPTNIAILGNDAYTSDWIKANTGAVVKYITDHPTDAATILQNSDQATKDAVLTAVNSGRAEKDRILREQAEAWIKQNANSKGAMTLATTMNNVWWAVQAGQMPSGIWYALYKINQGYDYPYAEYTQSDMDLALKYQKEGYWGPTGTGDPLTELRNAGLITGLSYNGENRWLNKTTKKSTGKNIASTDYGPNGGLSSQNIQGTLPTYTPTINSINCAENNMSSNYACRGDLMVGTRVGDTKTYTATEIKNLVNGKKTVVDFVEAVVGLKFTVSDVAKSLAIAGVVNTYDPNAVLNYIIALPGYALGPDNIIVRLAPGETKDPKTGLLQGTWSSDPGNVSYTEWARAWYCTGAGDVNGGKVVANDSGKILDQECWRYSLTGSTNTGSTSTSTSTPTITKFVGSPVSITSGGSSTLTWTSTNTDKCTLNGSTKSINGTLTVSPTTTTNYTLVCSKGTVNSASKTATVTVGTTISSSTTTNGNDTIISQNPYVSSLSAATVNKLDTWISTKVITRSSVLTPANYTKFLQSIITALDKVRLTTSSSSTNKLAMIDYLTYEIQQILDNSDIDSFLDSLFN